MCGIAGIFDAEPGVVAKALEAMNRTQAHRGPDDAGVRLIEMLRGCLGLGHRRLAIIDLSPAGHQPMEDPERGNWITYNGEIYNFRELRRELEGCGERFRTATDTEVILKAYGVWGRECVKRLRGIFAFGLWDAQRQGLLLARDQLGVKPLYLWEWEGRLVFASEVRAMLASGLVPRAVDLDGLHSYLAYGSVQEPFSLIRGIRSLPPGHVLEWQGGEARPTQYWALPPPDAVVPDAPADLKERLAASLTDAVGSQLVADVPLGAFLSGGIDSTAIAALAQQAGNGPVRTFSLVFREPRYDERRWSRLAARNIGSLHTEVELTGESVRERLPRALAAFDQPSLDGLNTYFVSGAAREAGLTVALSGVGGDELFGGYDGYRKPLLAARIFPALSWLPPGLRRAAAAGLNVTSRSEAARKLADLLVARRDPYLVVRRLFSDWQIRELLHPDIPVSTDWEEAAFAPVEAAVRGYDPINRASAFELETYMLSTLLRDTDQMSMVHALEVRVPLIDQRLVELLFALPGPIKLDRAQPKPLLTRPLDGLIPNECIHRPKCGFELPFEVWLRGAIEDQVRDALCGRDATGDLAPFCRAGMAQLWQDFRDRRVNWSRVWTVFVLKQWLAHHEIH
jgi:asparagine synthase (glutamine-hydrolysing)